MKEALKLALEALCVAVEPKKGKVYAREFEPIDCFAMHEQAITAIKEALAQPEQEPTTGNILMDSYKAMQAKKLTAQPEPEPVAYGMWDTMLGYGGRMMMVRLDKGQDGCTVPLYTTPPQQRTWVGLTDEEMMQIYIDLKSVAGFYSVEKYARDIEAKLRSKNENR